MVSEELVPAYFFGFTAVVCLWAAVEGGVTGWLKLILGVVGMLGFGAFLLLLSEGIEQMEGGS